MQSVIKNPTTLRYKKPTYVAPALSNTSGYEQDGDVSQKSKMYISAQRRIATEKRKFKDFVQEKEFVF